MFNGYPHTVKIGTDSFEIDPDFRIMTAFESGVQTSDTAAIISAVSDFFKGNIPADTEGAVKAVISFYLCGEASKEKSGGTGQKRCYDFKEDMRYFTAAFRQQYNIDLNTANLHWWEFSALFAGLTDETELVKIMQIRCTDVKNISDKSERNRIKRLQEHYALKEHRRKRFASAEERDRAMIEAAKKRIAEIERGECHNG